MTLETMTGRVGIFPAREHAARPRLLAALEDAYPVRFEAREEGDWEGLDGLLILGGSAPENVPSNLPVLHALTEEQPQDSLLTLELAHEGALARPLRGARITDGWSAPLDDGTCPRPHLVLAASRALPLWTASGEGGKRRLVSTAPAELVPGEALRERLAPGRCLALLALTHFLRELLRDPLLDNPPLRAAFVLDDPNLHWPSYGHVGYQELSGHALAHGYHVAVAMVPLDGWFAHPRAVRIFKQGSDQLSICVHGNDHDGPELGRISSEAEGVTLARHALQRAKAFERRTGVLVDKVMVPPHEKLSRHAATGLLEAGYEAVCVSRPYPWIVPEPDQSPLVAPAERGALAGWSGREIVAGGLPVLLRAGFNAPREDLILRAFLGQPLVLYGHHELLEHGLEVLSDAAAQINALGDVQWSSLTGIARSGVEIELPATLPTPLAAHRSRPRLRALARRIASEGRDRAHALLPALLPKR